MRVGAIALSPKGRTAAPSLGREDPFAWGGIDGKPLLLACLQRRGCVTEDRSGSPEEEAEKEGWNNLCKSCATKKRSSHAS